MRIPLRLVAVIAIFSFLLPSCETSPEQIGQILETVSAGRGGGGLTTQEIALGLREALQVGTKNASKQASRPGGFYSNPSLRIAFPPDAIPVRNFANNAGLGRQVTTFEQKLNAAAEQAAGRAQPIFVNAIKGMSINDAVGILRGGDYAATNYFRSRTSGQLKSAFRPVVEQSLQNVRIAKYWEPLTTAYNLWPKSSRQVNPDLAGYVTNEAVDGLFLLIGREEKKIREDPVARVSEILKRVFGSSMAR